MVLLKLKEAVPLNKKIDQYANKHISFDINKDPSLFSSDCAMVTKSRLAMTCTVRLRNRIATYCFTSCYASNIGSNASRCILDLEADSLV
jgi:hypothetical protein